MKDRRTAQGMRCGRPPRRPSPGDEAGLAVCALATLDALRARLAKCALADVAYVELDDRGGVPQIVRVVEWTGEDQGDDTPRHAVLGTLQRDSVATTLLDGLRHAGRVPAALTVPLQPR